MDAFILLQALKNPEDPAFNQALAQLANFNPASLKQEDLPIFLAQLEDTMRTLNTERDSTSQQLQKLRAQASALNSYGPHK